MVISKSNLGANVQRQREEKSFAVLAGQAERRFLRNDQKP